MRLCDIIFFLLPTIFLPKVASQNSQNFDAKLICTKTHIMVHITSKVGPFSGVVYTEGSYKQPGCHVAVRDQEKVIFDIPYDGCKTVQEDGRFANTVIIQHHERIMTEDDAAFRVACDQNNPNQGAEIIVTESMYMVHDKPRSFSKVENKPELKEMYKTKKVKTLYDDKGTYTYIPAKNKSISNINSLDQ